MIGGIKHIIVAKLRYITQRILNKYNNNSSIQFNTLRTMEIDNVKHINVDNYINETFKQQCSNYAHSILQYIYDNIINDNNNNNKIYRLHRYKKDNNSNEYIIELAELPIEYKFLNDNDLIDLQQYQQNEQ